MEILIYPEVDSHNPGVDKPPLLLRGEGKFIVLSLSSPAREILVPWNELERAVGALT